MEEEIRIIKIETGWLITLDGKMYHSGGTLEDAVRKCLQIREYLQAQGVKANA